MHAQALWIFVMYMWRLWSSSVDGVFQAQVVGD